MEFWKYKLAIVTGAGEGIGEQIAKDLVKHGLKVIGLECSREKAIKINTFPESNLWSKKLVGIKCDIAIDDDLDRTFKFIEENYGPVHLLVNNAAIGKAGLTVSSDVNTLKNIFEVNVYGLIACTRLAIKSMKDHNVEGLIININSICGHYMPPFEEPKTNAYLLSKRIMTTYSKLLKKELCNTKIKVTSLSPGIVKTNIFKTSGLDFINNEFFEKNPHLTVLDVSNVVLMVLEMNIGLQINEIIFHALNELY